jgi:hypothetical protein
MLMAGSYFGVFIALPDACFMRYVDRLLQGVFFGGLCEFHCPCGNKRYTVQKATNVSCYFMILSVRTFWLLTN